MGECETAYKEWCPSTTQVPYVYQTRTPTTQDRYGYRALTSTTRDRYTREAGFKKRGYNKFGKSKFTAPVRENLKYVLPSKLTQTPVRENIRYVLPNTRAACKQMPYKKCSKKPYNHCETKTTITIEYEDEEVCTPYTEDVCVDEPVYETVYEEVNQCRFVPERVCTQKVVTDCKTINRQECVKSSRTCNTRDLQEKQRVRNNCRVKDKVCKYKENEQCQVTKQPVEKYVPKRVCKDVCEPVVSNVCAPKTTRRQCKKIPKKMFYQVPVEQC